MKRKKISERSIENNSSNKKIAPIFDSNNWREISVRASQFSNRASRASELEKCKNNHPISDEFKQHFQDANFDSPCFMLVMNGIGYSPIDEKSSPMEFRAHNITTLDTIGTIRLDLGEDDNIWLDAIEVDEASRRCGIGTTLIKLAKFFHHDLKIPNRVHEVDDYQYTLSSAGQELINSCLEQGILDRKINCRALVPLQHDKDKEGFVHIQVVRGDCNSSDDGQPSPLSFDDDDEIHHQTHMRKF